MGFKPRRISLVGVRRIRSHWLLLFFTIKIDIFHLVDIVFGMKIQRCTMYSVHINPLQFDVCTF